MSIALLCIQPSVAQTREDWQQFRAFGGQTFGGTITTLMTDVRYLYAFSQLGGARYDKLLDKWDFSFPSTAPDPGYDFVAQDFFLNDFYFVYNNRTVPYHPVSDIYYSAIEFPARINRLAFDGQRIWARTSAGIYSCDRFSHQITRAQDPGAGLSWTGPLRMRDITDDPSMRFLTPGFIIDRWADLHPITAVSLEQVGTTIWVAYAGLGLWRYDRTTQRGSQVTQGFLASQDVRAFAGFRKTVGMAGDGGVTLYDGAAWQQLGRLFNANLANYQLRALALDDRELFIGTERGLLALPAGDDFAGTFSSYDGLPSSRINCLCLDRDSLWVGTDLGAALLLRTTRTVFNRWADLEGYIVNGIAADRQGVYLATARGGVKLVKADSLRPMIFSDPSPTEMSWELRAVAADSNMVWWLGPQVLLGYDKTADTWDRFTAAGNYTAGENYCLAADSANVWIGTSFGLVRYFKDGGRFAVYHTTDGLMDERVLAVWSRDGYLWAGGPTGVSRLRWRK